jgi:hypothetical protein
MSKVDELANEGADKQDDCRSYRCRTRELVRPELQRGGGELSGREQRFMDEDQER